MKFRFTEINNYNVKRYENKYHSLISVTMIKYRQIPIGYLIHSKLDNDLLPVRIFSLEKIKGCSIRLNPTVKAEIIIQFCNHIEMITGEGVMFTPNTETLRHALIRNGFKLHGVWSKINGKTRLYKNVRRER